MRMFHDCIADLTLREIMRVGARYTWSNNRVDPIWSVMDRVFVSVEWEIAFPLCLLHAVTRIGSDHSPLLLSTRGGAPPRLNHFHFENFWITQLGFVEAVNLKWEDARTYTPRVFNAVDVWHHCAKLSRHFMGCWGAYLGAELRQKKGLILDRIQGLDAVSDFVGLSAEELLQRYSLETFLMDIYKGEEVFW
jgi:hypothetical protein